MSTVNIVTSDRGWILERLATEIAARLPYVTFGDGPDPAAAIQYYVTYSSRRRRLSPVEVAYFAHLEPEGAAHDLFFAVARDVEHCVCHAHLYEAVLRDAGIAAVTTIPPGVDLDAFQPKLRIGVVGRTYHTGRKGEHLVAEVMDIPGIEWCFTGEGWPAPALDLPPERMPELYRSLDYVLVPALYEGGPMCVAEALACGTPVIAPPIGWVPDFPHVEFRTGDAADLRRVLLGLLETKRALRASTLAHGWDAWAAGHDRLFRTLAATHGLTLAAPAPRPARPPRPRSVGVILHGEEDRVGGGPTNRAPRLVRELLDAGVEAELRRHPSPKGLDGLDLVHVFNAWSPLSGADVMRRARRAGLATVLSPIFLDLSLAPLWDEKLVQLFAAGQPGAAMKPALAAFRAELAAERAADAEPAEILPGFHDAMREMAALADRLILLSDRERRRLERIGVDTAHARIVRNPVDPALYGAADPEAFRRHIGLRDFVLCLARIEPRKNQLMLAHALRDTGLPLVLVGHAEPGTYRQVLERHAPPGLRMVERLPPNSPLLASALAAARVVVLPSWAEGAPLAALEAAAAGAALVLSDASGESEYFGDLARYCDPGDPASIRAAVQAAWDSPRDAATVADQKSRIARSFGWATHREATEAVYAEAIAARRPAPTSAPVPALRIAGRQRIVVDLTTTALRTGRWTGIARVEAALARALLDHPEAEASFIGWNDRARGFVELPAQALRDATLGEAIAAHGAGPLPPLELPAGAHLLIAGSAWMQNRRYAEGVVAFAKAGRLRLVALIHDVIPTRFPFWFEDGYAPVFAQNLALLLDGADHAVAVSESTRRDLEAHAARTEALFLPPVSVLREGDEIGQDATPADGAERMAPRFGDRPFVLCVGAIHARKNHRLLYDVWLRLAARMGEACPHLVLVGGVAWNGHDVARALRGDARISAQVSILDDVDDAALDWLYAHCLFTVYPSLHEGWGLPVAESLRHGKLCLAADTSSVPEIAPGLVELIDPQDVVLWAAKVRFYAGSAAARAAAEARIAAQYRPTPWSASATQLLGHLAAAAPRAPHPYDLGTVVPFSEPVMAARIQGAGWHPFEDWGCFAATPRAELLFAPPLPPRGALALVAEARAVPPFTTQVLVDGEPVARWDFPDGDLRVLRADIPEHLARRATPLRVTFATDALSPLRAAGGAVTQVGIGLAAVSLAPAALVRDPQRYVSVAGRLPETVTLGRAYDLLGSDAGRVFLGGRWIAHAAWGMFCADRRPRLRMLLPEGTTTAIEIELRLRPVATPAAPLRLRLLAGGEAIGAWSLDDASPTTLRATLPAALVARAALLVLDLVPEEPRSPAALGLGAAAEGGGFGLIGFTFRPAGGAPSRPRLTLSPTAPLLLSSAQAPAAAAALREALGTDWHAPEPSATWTFGREALLPLRLDPVPRERSVVMAELEGFRPAPGATEIRLEVLAGTTVLAHAALRPRELRTVAIPIPPRACGPDGALDLLLRVDSAPSPFIAGEGQDERALGLRLVRLRLARVPVLLEGRVMRFGLAPGEVPPAPDPADMLVGDWYAREPGGCWSQGAGGALSLTVSEALPQGWRLFLACRTIGGAPGRPAMVELRLDDEPLGRWGFTSTATVIAEVPGLAARMAGRQAATLALRRVGSASPAELGLGDDRRNLGVMAVAALAAAPGAARHDVVALFAAAGAGTLKPLAEPPPAAATARDRYEFGTGGNAEELEPEGWYDPEPEGRWAKPEGATLRLRRPARPVTRLVLTLDVRVFGLPPGGTAAVEVLLDGEPALALRFTTDAFERRSLAIALDEGPTAGEILLGFRRPDAPSPADLRQGSDSRRLGLMLRTLAAEWK